MYIIVKNESTKLTSIFLLIFRSKSMIMPDLYREVSNIDQFECVEKTVDTIPSSLTEHMDISPSMVVTPSPTNTDWLQQFCLWK